MSTAFLTDKYEFTMLQAALESGVAHKKATFELFARRLPKGRRYGVVGGMDRMLEAVTNFYFSHEQIEHLSKDPIFKPETIEYLTNYKFTGNIYGYHEGDLYFGYSPIVTVEATFADAVLLETVMLSILNHDSAVASAGARMVEAAKGIKLIEMGSRRTHEEAAVAAARAAYITGFAATSNMEAGFSHRIPTTGTSAHAFTLAHATEKEAFAAQVAALGIDTTLLVDTYDIEQGIRNAIEVAGTELGGIRIDSGDLIEETFKARILLDSLGAVNTKIVLSSDIDEYSITTLTEAGAPVDGLGVGTRLVTGSGHPTAGMVFKLVEREDDNGNMIPVAKRASGKKSIGGRKRAFRVYEDGYLTGEKFTLDPTRGIADPVQIAYMQGGIPQNVPTLEQAREYHTAVRKTLPPEALSVEDGPAYIEAEDCKD
jgi:nicotinate phosphoribosyltransferase